MKVEDVEFRVWWDGGRWAAEAVYEAGDGSTIETLGHGSTPVIAMINAEARVRKALK